MNSKKSKTYGVVDTSVQYEKVKNLTYFKDSKISELQLKLRSSHFVLYEYKTGLVRSLIDYYYLVNISATPSEAMMTWSNMFSPRDIKNFTILQGLILSFDGKIDGDKKIYLGQLEYAIRYVLDVFKCDIENWLVGDFSSDPIVKYKITDATSFKAFCELVNTQKIIPMSAFWKKKHKELTAIVSNADPCPNVFKDQIKILEKLSTNIEEADKKVRLNKKLGDPVICIDTSKDDTLITKDAYQDYLRGVLKFKKVLVTKL